MEDSIRHIQMYGIVRGNGYSTNRSGKVYTLSIEKANGRIQSIVVPYELYKNVPAGIMGIFEIDATYKKGKLNGKQSLITNIKVVNRDISEDECFDQKVKDLVSLQSEEKPVNRAKRNAVIIFVTDLLILLGGIIIAGCTVYAYFNENNLAKEYSNYVVTDMKDEQYTEYSNDYISYSYTYYVGSEKYKKEGNEKYNRELIRLGKVMYNPENPSECVLGEYSILAKQYIPRTTLSVIQIASLIIISMLMIVIGMIMIIKNIKK